MGVLTFHAQAGYLREKHFSAATALVEILASPHTDFTNARLGLKNLVLRHFFLCSGQAPLRPTRHSRHNIVTTPTAQFSTNLTDSIAKQSLPRGILCYSGGWECDGLSATN